MDKLEKILSEYIGKSNTVEIRQEVKERVTDFVNNHKVYNYYVECESDYKEGNDVK